MKVTLVSSSPTRHPSPPLGIAYLAVVLRENNYDVNIVDFSVVKDGKDFERRIKKSNPDIVGFSVQTNGMRIAFDSAKIVRDIFPGSLIIFGGPHPTVMPEQTLKDSECDICVIGEGEYTLLDIVKTMDNRHDKQLSKIKGVWYKQEGKIKINPPRPFVENLDKLPLPARDLLPMDYYLNQIPVAPFPMRYLHIHAHRGCPFNCAFCQPTSHKMWGRKIRMRSPKSLCDEAELIAEKYKLNALNFSADTFTVSKKWVIEFCKEYRKRGIDLPWTADSRVNTADYETLKEMKRARCFWLGVGVESGSQEILDILGKGITIKQTEQFFKWCNELGITTQANIMMGNPNETKETLQTSIDLIKRIKPDAIGPFFTNPICGTYLYDYAVENNLLKTKEYEKLDRHNLGNIFLENITEEDLKLYRERLLKEYTRLKLSYIFNPRWFLKKGYLHRATAKRLLSLLRYMNYGAFKRSYNMLHTHTKNPAKKIIEMIIKGLL